MFMQIMLAESQSSLFDQKSVPEQSGLLNRNGRGFLSDPERSKIVLHIYKMYSGITHNNNDSFNLGFQLMLNSM